MQATKRDASVDVIKGLAIIAMVIGHSCMYSPTDNFVNLFHMSCFLMASGFFFKAERLTGASGAWQWVKGKVSRLYFPFVFWTIAFILLQNLLIKINVYSDDPRLLECVKTDLVYLVHPLSVTQMAHRFASALVLQGSTVLTGPLWFVRTLFWVCLAYGALSWLLQKLRLNEMMVQTFVALCFFWGGKYVSHPILEWIGGPCFFVAYALFHFGRVLHQAIKHDRIARIYNSIITGGVGAGILIAIYCAGFYICIAQNAYKSGLVVATSALGGWLALLSCHHLMAAHDGSKLLSVISYIGRHTMPILIFHLLAFRVVNYIGIGLSHGTTPWYCVAAESNLYSSWYAKVGYVVVGVGLPLAIDWIYRRLTDEWKAKLISK